MFNKNKIKLGIAPIGWTNDDLPELGGDIPFEQCIAEMAEAEFTGCEIGNKFPHNPNILKKALEPFKLQIVSAWFSAFFTETNREQETIAGFLKHMNFLNAMGAKLINIAECGHCTQQKNLPILTNKPIFDEKQWKNLIFGLENLGHLAKEKNMTIVYHHHMGTGIQTQEEINRLMEETNPELVSLLYDTGHIYFAGGDTIQLIKDHKNRIKHVHLKDIRKNVLEQVKLENLSFLDAVKAGVFTVPGDGCINFDAIFSALSEINYQGWLLVEAEQDPAKANPLVYAKKARKFIRDKTGL